jgi:hypothetical protein
MKKSSENQISRKGARLPRRGQAKDAREILFVRHKVSEFAM